MKAAVMNTVLAVHDPVAEAGRLGFAGVELDVTRAQLRSFDGAWLGHVRREATAASVAIHGLVLGEHNHGGIASADSVTAESAADDVKLAIGLAAELGAGVFHVPFFMDAQLHSDADV